MPLKIKQDSQYKGTPGDNWWEWSVQLAGTEEKLKQVKHVDYVLHPTFPNPVRTVTNRRTNFKLATAGWGAFKLYANVTFKDGTKERLSHDVKLQLPSGKLCTD